LEGHVGEEGFNSNWSTKRGLAKKTPLTKKFSHMLKNSQVEFAFLYALLPCYEGAKQDTIGVEIGANAKLPHCTNITLAYLMENKMSLVHHVVEWWGCIYKIKNNIGINERTRGHPIMKPMFKLMKVGWDKGKY